MKHSTYYTDSELVTEAQKTVARFRKTIDEAQNIASKYGFELSDSDSNILNFVFSKMKEERDASIKAHVESVFQSALEALSKQGKYQQMSELLNLFQSKRYDEVRLTLMELGLFRDQSIKHPLVLHGKKAAKTCLHVTFPDGKVICHIKSAQTFAEVIDIIGPEKVAELEIRMSGRPLVSKEKYEMYERGQQEISNGWFVTTHSNTNEKVHNLKKISEALGLDLIVKKVEKNSFELD